jgi:hypothetical protein
MMQTSIYNVELLLRNHWAQRLLIIFTLILVFWHGLWGGAPRTDQVIYLHQISQFNNFWDIFTNAPSWNRTQSAGDFILYRPILYLLLGSFYYVFEYDFVKWQIASLVLHVIVVLGVHSLLLLGRLRLTLYPLLLAIFFGVSLLGSELVLWNHIVGYILFSAFLVYSVYFLVIYFQKNIERYAWLSLLIGCFAQFTYEFGVILNIFIIITFCYRHYSYYRSNSLHKSNIKWAILFLFSVLLYPLFSVLDLWLNGFDVMPSEGQVFSIQSIFLASSYAFKQILFWLGCWVLPAAYDIDAGGRAVFYGLNLTSPIFIINLIAVLSLFFILMRDYGIEKIKVSITKYNLSLIIIFCLFFLFSYSFIIAYGRTLPRGLYYVLANNIYYSYIACLICSMAFALVTIKCTKGNLIRSKADSKEFNFEFRNLFIFFCFFILISFNAYGVFKVSKSYRYDYSLPRLELISRVSNWLETEEQNPSSFFWINPDCEGNHLLTWVIEEDMRKNMGWKPPVSLLELLFPEKSYFINRHNLEGEYINLAEFKCGPH